MISILLEDKKNKLYHEIRDLSEERELHIRKNINILNKVEDQYTIYFLDEESIKNIKSAGYTCDRALYDRIIQDYNLQNSEKGLLTAWIR